MYQFLINFKLILIDSRSFYVQPFFVNIHIHIHIFQQILFLDDVKKSFTHFFFFSFLAEAKISKCFVFFDLGDLGFGVRSALETGP